MGPKASARSLVGKGRKGLVACCHEVGETPRGPEHVKPQRPAYATPELNKTADHVLHGIEQQIPAKRETTTKTNPTTSIASPRALISATPQVFRSDAACARHRCTPRRPIHTS